MRKILVVVMIFVSIFMLSGCGQERRPENSFSEITYDYYSGTNDTLFASISVGKREEPYAIDGNHGENVDFSLVTLKFSSRQQFNQLAVDVVNDDGTMQLLLEFNPLNNSYMGDLGRAIDGEISIIYGETILNLQKTSENFSINYQTAIEKAILALDGEIEKYYTNGIFEGECYLKILSEVDEKFEDLYWVFTIVGKNGDTSNVVIDTITGDTTLSN